jgi:hypothetical protein
MAHVMTYDELKKVKQRELVFEETRHVKHHVRTLYFNGMDFTDGKHFLFLSECNEKECPNYNWNYRVWNEMPTEKEMDNTPWKEDPYV